MTLFKIAKACERNSEEGNLRIQIRSLSEEILENSTFGKLLDKITKKDIHDYNVVEIQRGNLVPEDSDRPVWNKSLIIYVV